MTTHKESYFDRPKDFLLYLVESDASLAKTIMVKLEQAGYQAQHFIDFADFEVALEKKIPSVIIIDMLFKGDEFASADSIDRLQAKGKTCPPVIFISESDAIEVRLAAARAGAYNYFVKPLVFRKLFQTLDTLIALAMSQPYRILFIDDDKMLLEYYAELLSDEDMHVETLSNPLETLNVLNDFKPDVVVMDVHMPECSGLELTKIIKQDDAWATIPIMFLSSSLDLNLQLEGMNLGCDDFLVKPLDRNHLISAITARAKRVRWSNRLTQDLKTSLRESEYQHITMDQHDLVSMSDVGGLITSVNEKFCEVSGYSREELIGNNHRMLKSDYHPASFYNELWDTISQGKVWHGTICNRKKNGDEYWVESTIVPFLDDKGKPYKYVSARTDITALRQSEERLSRSQEFANIGTWDWNIQSHEVYLSDRARQLYGYIDELKDVNFEDYMNIVYPDDQFAVRNAVKACLQKGVNYDVEHRIVWPDGSVHWLQERGDVVRSEKGEWLHMLGVVQDIDERKFVEKELINAREDADNANRAKSQFLSSMSHELRTPMNAIMGFSQLMKMETAPGLNESQLENVNEIMKASGHLLDLINDVLDLSKIEAGHIELSIETVALGEVISESLQLIKPLAQKQHIDISLTRNDVELTFEQFIEQRVVVRADYTRLKQVLLNLLSNAVKYNCEKGKILIACTYTEDKHTRISISDTGAGLNLQQQSQLFKAFNRLGADETEIEGTGIGLVITKNIVELMGGNIGVESQPGVGSTFWIELPNDTMLNEKEIATNQSVTVSASSPFTDPEREHTVLYIEDNPANLRLIAQLLGRMKNIHMWSAHEPMLGLELAAEHKPDLILLDINLPGIDGFEVLKRLRQNEATNKTPVIAISANAMPNDIEKGLKAGFDDYITKPVNVKALLQAVKSKLDDTQDAVPDQ